jgi:hypothetical protein
MRVWSSGENTTGLRHRRKEKARFACPVDVHPSSLRATEPLKAGVLNLWNTFTELVVTPFQQMELVWGIVPLYFGWLSNELTSSKRSFRTAIQTGFSFLWAGAHWTYQYFAANPAAKRHLTPEALMAVNVMVTMLVLLLGATALLSGLRRRYPPYGSFLGHTRFSNYFMIAIFPLQSRYLDWSWERVFVILLFAIPTWLLVHFGLMPLRK